MRKLDIVQLRKPLVMTWIYAGIHFVVDCACIFMLTAFLIPVLESRETWLWCVLLYNLFAFAFQLPVGAVADWQGRSAFISAFGCCLICMGYLLLPVPLLASVVAGLGNACFHVGAGIDVLTAGKGKAALPGIYVSTGAFGVYVGMLMAVKGFGGLTGIKAGVISVLFVCAGLLSILERMKGTDLSKWEGKTEELGIRRIVIAASMCLLFTICVRSYVGTILRFSWKSESMLGLLFILGIVLGKLVGGVVGDRLGWRLTAVGGLSLSALFFLFAFSSPLFGISGVFLFNMTMPVTLTALGNLFSGQKGFAFGMTTFALFLGVIPSMFSDKSVLFQRGVLSGFILLSAVIVYLGLTLYTKMMSGERR